MSRSDSSVKDYGLQNGNIIHLVVKLSDLLTINVKTSSGKDFTFHVDRNRDVAYLNKQLANTPIINQQDVVLCEGEEQLQDDRLIHDISKHNNNGLIYLFLKKSTKIRVTPKDKNFELDIAAPQQQQQNDSTAAAAADIHHNNAADDATGYSCSLLPTIDHVESFGWNH